MVEIPALIDLLKSGTHFGHKKSKRHPKMAPYIFATRDEINIIDLGKTVECLKQALEYITSVVRAGGVILFVGTKRQGAQTIKDAALSCAMPFVNGRWLGGTLTNFSVISKMIKKYKRLKEKRDAGELVKYTKKEQLDIAREIEELDLLIGGIQQLGKLPDALFILDLKRDSTALAEARRKNIPIIALCDTNTNPEKVGYPIPANDDAVKSIQLIVGLVAQAIGEGKELREKDIVQSMAAPPAPAQQDAGTETANAQTKDV